MKVRNIGRGTLMRSRRASVATVRFCTSPLIFSGIVCMCALVAIAAALTVRTLGQGVEDGDRAWRTSGDPGAWDMLDDPFVEILAERLHKHDDIALRKALVAYRQQDPEWVEMLDAVAQSGDPDVASRAQGMIGALEAEAGFTLIVTQRSASPEAMQLIGDALVRLKKAIELDDSNEDAKWSYEKIVTWLESQGQGQGGSRSDEGQPQPGQGRGPGRNGY